MTGLNIFWSYVALFVGSILVLILCGIALRLWKANVQESETCAALAPSFLGALLGRTRVKDDIYPDTRVHSGLIYNKKANRLEISARLRPSALDRIFR